MTFIQIQCLPPDVVDRLAAFLDDQSLVFFSRCNKFFRSKFNIARLESDTPELHEADFHIYGGNEDGNDFFRQLTIPMAASCRRTRTIQFEFMWHDQGWGNRKGRVAILASSSRGDRPPQQMTKDEVNRHGRIVCCTANEAPHRPERLVLTFAPQPNEDYTLYMIPGSGGGHELRMHFIRVYSVILDKPEWSISRCFGILSDLGVIGRANSPFLLDMLQMSVHSLLQGSLQSRSNDVARFLSSNGLNAEDTSTLESILELLAHHHMPLTA